MRMPSACICSRSSSNHSVESILGELERLSVADAEVHCAALLAGTTARNLQHAGTKVDACEADVVRIERQIPAGADSDLEDLPTRLRASPLPTALEEHPLREANELVVPGSEPLVDPQDPRVVDRCSSPMAGRRLHRLYRASSRTTTTLV